MWRGWVEREAKQGGGVSRLLPPDPPGRFLTTRLDNDKELRIENSMWSTTRQKFNKSVSLETLSSATLDLAIKVRLRVKSVILIIIMLDLIQWWMSILFDRDGASSSGCLQPHLCLPRGGGFWPRLVSNNFKKMKQFSKINPQFVLETQVCNSVHPDQLPRHRGLWPTRVGRIQMCSS